MSRPAVKVEEGAPSGAPDRRPRTLGECRPGDEVTVKHSGERVTVEVANICRVRIRPHGHTIVRFTDPKTGEERTVKARKPARDVAPSVEVVCD